MKTRRTVHQQPAAARRGVIIPLVAVALLVVMAAVALVLDQLWLSAAAAEMTSVAESASLAAAGALADDDLLRTGVESAEMQKYAGQLAADIARQNQVAGESVFLDVRPGQDIRFGRLVFDPRSGFTQFVEGSHNSNTVVVTARRTRSRANPVALFFAGVTGQAVADVVRRAEATVDNRLIGIQAFDGAPVPAFPLAILKSDPAGVRTDTWDVQVESRQGGDQYTYDRSSGRVGFGADGIPEIVLMSMTSRGGSNKANLQLIDVGTDLVEAELIRQILGGWTPADLQQMGGTLMLVDGRQSIVSGGVISSRVAENLYQMLGRSRIVALYTHSVSEGSLGFGTLRLAGLAAGRIMAVRALSDDAYEIVFQPAVIITRTAVVPTHASSDGEEVAVGNRYIYKLHLTQ